MAYEGNIRWLPGMRRGYHPSDKPIRPEYPTPLSWHGRTRTVLQLLLVHWQHKGKGKSITSHNNRKQHTLALCLCAHLYNTQINTCTLFKQESYHFHLPWGHIWGELMLRCTSLPTLLAGKRVRTSKVWFSPIPCGAFGATAYWEQAVSNSKLLNIA